MELLVVGLFIWIAAHLFRSVAKEWRASFQSKLGDGSKGVMALIIVASLVLMVLGYRSAEESMLWAFGPWAYHVNNALMFLALYIYFTTATVPGTAFILGNIKNPQLIGFKVWAVAHLLVNGDVASLVLFGGLLVWAVLQIMVSDKSSSLVDRSKAPIKSPVIHLLLVVVVFVVIAGIHSFLGVKPFV